MQYKEIKRKVFEIVDPNGKGKLNKAFDVFIISLISINVLLVILDTFESLGAVKDIFFAFELVSVIIFTVEYAMRLWTADLLFPKLGKVKSRLKYMISFMAIIDIVSILPFYLPMVLPRDFIALRSLRALRLLRFFKLGRNSTAFSTLGNIFKRKSSQLASSVLIIFLLMVVTSIMMYNVEHTAQPEKFHNAFDSLWWSIATITTIGYGDIAPITMLGKVLGAVTAFLGIGLVAIPTGILSAGYLEQLEIDRQKQRRELRKQIELEKAAATGVPPRPRCPHCGELLEEK